MSFLRHGRSIGPMGSKENRGTEAPLPIVRDESHRLSLGGLHSCRARLRFAGCLHRAIKKSRRSSGFHRTAACGLTGCLSPWVHFSRPAPSAIRIANSLLRSATRDAKRLARFTQAADNTKSASMFTP